MTTALLTIMIISGIIFAISLLLMNPKWWLGMWIAGFWWSHEYGSKKSITATLKKVATISSVIFIIVVLVYPFVS